jgi:uroporphyrin-3 C-methyltransferase
VNQVTPTSPSRLRLFALLGLGAILVAAVLWAWLVWQSRQDQARQAANEGQRQLDALLQRMDTVRGDINAQSRLLKDASAGQRLLRDEVLGLGQRNALLEETVARLAVSSAQGSQAVRLDEVELLLVLGAQRLRIAGDVEGARRAYALAAGVVEGLDDPGLLNLRQTLASERQALDRLGAGPRTEVLQRLEALSDRLAALPQQPMQASLHRRPPWWQRALAPLVQIRPAGEHDVLSPGERERVEDGLQLELTLARASLERGDVDAFHTALNRIDRWARRLWPDSPELRQVQAELQSLQAAPLQPQGPALEATLLQLRAARDGGRSRP